MPGPVTVPPDGSSTVRVGRGTKDAETVRSPVIVTVQDRLPVQAPPHDRRPDPPSGVAVSGTRWPGCRTAGQGGPPAGGPAAGAPPVAGTRGGQHRGAAPPAGPGTRAGPRRPRGGPR